MRLHCARTLLDVLLRPGGLVLGDEGGKVSICSDMDTLLTAPLGTACAFRTRLSLSA